jgi:transposase
MGMVKKLLQQRRHTGDIRPQHHRAGRKPKILEKHRQRFQRRLARQPDLTLKQLRQAVRLTCSLPAIHYALADLNLTYKKRHSGPANRSGPTSPPAGLSGSRNA